MRLTDPLPLRPVAELAGYRADGVCPRVYGDLSAAPIVPPRIGETRYLFADHAAEVTAVWIDGQKTAAWEAAVEALENRSLTVISLTAPPPVGATVTAAGRGVRGGASGTVLENPADILADLLDWAGAGHLPLRDRLERLRLECDRAGLTVAGALTEPITLRQAISRIAGSVGAAWSAATAWLHPPSRIDQPVPEDAPEPLAEARVVEATVGRDEAGGEVEIAFGERAGESAWAGRLALRASPALATGQPMRVEAPWLRGGRQAEVVARRLLADRVPARWRLVLECSPRPDLPAIGDTVAFSHPASPLSGRHWFTVTGRALGDGRIRLSGDLHPAAATRLYNEPRLTQAGEVTQYAAVEAALAEGVATFTLTDPQGRPLVGARASLDGGSPQRADAQGRVRFSGVRAGRHRLAVEADGYAPFEIEINL